MDEFTKDTVLGFLKAHKAYFNTGETRDIDFRIAQLKKLKMAIKKYENEILDALYKDLGKSEFEGYATEIGFTLNSISYMVKNLKKWAKVKKVRTSLYQFPSKGYIFHEPYGTVLIIGPFNYPFQLLIEPLIGAMAAGNCVILKPSEVTENITKLMKKIIEETFDSKYIRVIEGEKEVNSELINSPLDYIFFTGSVNVGKIVMEAASKNLVPVTLELGGKSPAIVDKSANLDVIVDRLLFGKFVNVGQTCVAPDYVLVNKEIKEKLIERIKVVINNFYGKDIIESKDYGRIASERYFDRLVNLIECDREKIVFGGNYNKEKLFIEPTVLSDVSYKDKVMEEEIFGPILPILEYEDLDDTIEELKRHHKPLALYIFTESKEVEKKVLNNLSFGGGCVNDTISHVAETYLPFGGVGNSGIGAYHGKASFQVFSHKKSVLKKSTRFNIKLIFPPYGNKVSLVRKFFK
ncbi:MAG: aldehyde dehydrogenase [Clostridiaceae bacterium]